MPEREDVPALEDESSEHATQHDDGANDLKHSVVRKEPTGAIRPFPVSDANRVP